MQKFILTVLILGSSKFFSQGGWAKVTTATNPLTTFTSNGFYKGCAWIDFDNDGLIDLSAAPNYLFRNLGAGNFSTMATGILPAPMQDPGGLSWADLNGDTLPDMLLAQYPAKIYLNAGNGNFTDFTPNLPNFTNYAAWGCAIGDYNKDNRLDLLFVHANGFHGTVTPAPCKLFVQKSSNFDFVQKTGYAFTDSLRPYTVPYWSDYDLDGDMDLFIASGPGGAPGYDYCYRNMKTELNMDTLYRLNGTAFTTDKQDGQCYNFVDYDNDGDLDLCLTNYGGAQTHFYKNNSGVFTFSATPFTLTQQFLSNCWGDYDNDGDLDVVITSDNLAARYFRNNGNGSFTQLSTTFNNAAGSAGIANGDYDNDGDLDLFVHGAGNARALFRNDTVAKNRNSVNFRLVGRAPNTSAIGATVKLKATINGTPTWQFREINAQNSFQGQNDLRVHFGLNNASTIDSVIINWPSGTKQIFSNLLPMNFYVVKETSGISTSVKTNTFQEFDFMIYPNPAKSSLSISLNFEPTGNSLIRILDMSGREVYNQVPSHKSQEIDLSKLSEGTYLVSVSINGNSKTQKIILKQ